MLEKLQEKDNTQEIIKEMVVQIGELDYDWDLRESSLFENDLGFDSLKMIDLVVEIEQEFGVQINETQLVDIETFGCLLKFVRDFQLRN